MCSLNENKEGQSGKGNRRSGFWLADDILETEPVRREQIAPFLLCASSMCMCVCILICVCGGVHTCVYAKSGR